MPEDTDGSEQLATEQQISQDELTGFPVISVGGPITTEDVKSLEDD